MDRMPSVMNHNFSQVPHADIPRSSFNRSHGLKTTMDSSYLIPVFLDEVVPGDTMNLSMHGFGRLATPIHPLMDNLHLETFFFFCPTRLVWDNHQKFHGEQVDPGDSTDYQIPTFTTTGGGIGEGTLGDYFGLPTKQAGVEFSTLPFRCYQKIFNEWFRDENLIDSSDFTTGDGPETGDWSTIQKRGKRHDYFTSCLPWPQKSDAGAVSLPLGTTAPVTAPSDGTSSTPILFRRTDTGATISTTNIKSSATGAVESNGAQHGYFDPNGSLTTDLSSATAATINQLREAFQVQKLYERDARGGTRYTEIIRAHFGVTSPDARLQRPEYLGGGSSMFNINEVPQTSSTDATTPQGNLAAYGTVGFSGHGFTKSFTEHGYIIGIANVRGDITYQQGLDKLWSRRDRFDFYYPSLAHLGEQAVLSKEIYADGSANDEDVFGYQERFAEMRYKRSQVTGLFRSNATTSLESWHLSEDFASRPTLNSTFIEDNTITTLDRAIALPSEPQVILDAYFKYTCARPMPTYSVPGLIDHF